MSNRLGRTRKGETQLLKLLRMRRHQNSVMWYSFRALYLSWDSPVCLRKGKQLKKKKFLDFFSPHAYWMKVMYRRI